MSVVERKSGHAVRFDGIGDPDGVGNLGGAEDALGTLWCEPVIQEHAADLTDYRNVHPYLVPGSVSSLSTSLDRRNGQTTWSGIQIKMIAEDAVAERFLAPLGRSNGETSSAIGPGDTSINLSNTSLSEGIIHVGSEAIEILSNDGGGDYTVQRGRYNTIAIRHPAKSNVFTRIPHLESRPVTLLDFHWRGPDFGWDITERWHGRIDGKVDQKNGDIIIPTVEGLAGLGSVEAGDRDRTPESIVGGEVTYKPEGGSFTCNSGQMSHEPRIKKDSTFPDEMGFEVHGQYVSGQNNLPDFEADGTRFSGSPSFGGEWDKDEFEDRVSFPIEERKVHEVLLVDQEKGISPLLQLEDEFSGRQNSEIFPYHVLSFYAAFHLSTPSESENRILFDMFTPSWSLMANRFFESGIHTTIADLIENNPRDHMDMWVLGEGGKSVNLRKEIMSKLNAYDYIEGLNNDGLLTIRKSTNPDVIQAESASGITPRPSDMTFTTGRGAGVSEVTVRLNENPIEDSMTTSVTLDNGGNPSIPQRHSTDELTLDFGGVDRDRRTFAENRAIQKGLRSYTGVPTLKITVEDHRENSRDYTVGGEIRIDQLHLDPEWIVDKNSKRVKIPNSDNETQWIGLIVGRQYKPSNREYELEVLLPVSVVAKLRAPSAVVSSWDGDTNTITVKGSDPKSVYADSVTDAERFDVDDDIEIYNPDYTKWANSKIREITSIDTSAGEITLDGGFGGYDPSGKVVKLAHADTDDSGTGYQNDSPTIDGTTYTDAGRVYVYIGSESQGTLGAAQIDPDEYGA